VDSFNWNGNIGAITFGNGTTGVSGAVSSSNSLVGSTAGDMVGQEGIIALTNGNYVVDSILWNGFRGAVTFGNGTTGVTGTVSSSNSLVGSTAGDSVGNGAIIPLASGNYGGGSSRWNGDIGAFTFGNGSKGTTGTISSSNSVLGHTALDLGSVVVDNADNAFYVSFPGDGSGTVYRGSSISGFFGPPALPNGEVLLSSIISPDSTVYDLTALGNLFSFAAGDTSWTLIDSNVLKISLAGNGDLVDLKADGTLKEFTAVGSASSYVQLDAGVTSFAIAGNGDVVDLHGSGNLFEFTAFRSGSAVNIDTNVASFQISAIGYVEDQHYTTGNKYIQTSFRGPVNQPISQFM